MSGPDALLRIRLICEEITEKRWPPVRRMIYNMGPRGQTVCPPYFTSRSLPPTTPTDRTVNHQLAHVQSGLSNSLDMHSI